MKFGRVFFFLLSWFSAILTGCGRESDKAGSEGGLEPLPTPIAAIEEAYKSRRSDMPVIVMGQVIKLLRDDTEGERHQRFVIGLVNGRTILVTHNIDKAPRLDNLKEGDTVKVKGEYVWNEQGGLIHWTHHDPNGTHAGGWIVHDGHRYE